MTHYWRLRVRLPERHGQACRVLVRGRLNTVLVEFGDGYRVAASRYAVRRAVGEAVTAGIAPVNRHERRRTEQAQWRMQNRRL